MRRMPLAEERVQRRLAAIALANIAGCSCLMEVDEAGTLATPEGAAGDYRSAGVRADGGRIVKVMGDGVLIEFGSAVSAVAVEIQRQKAEVSFGSNFHVPTSQ